MRISWFSNRRRLPVLVLALYLALLATAGCVSPGSMSGGGGRRNGPGGGQGSGPAQPVPKGYREFYIAPGVRQLFLLPVRLPGPGKRFAELDLVVRDSLAVLSAGLLHVTFSDPDGAGFAPTDTLLLGTGGRPLALAPPRVLYSELHGAVRLTRLEAPLASAQLLAYLRSPTRSLLLGRATGGRQAFGPDKKALVRLDSFGAAVLVH